MAGEWNTKVLPRGLRRVGLDASGSRFGALGFGSRDFVGFRGQKALGLSI